MRSIPTRIIRLFAIIVVILGLFIGPVSAADPFASLFEPAKSEVTVHFFYNPSCGSCQKVLPFIEEYEVNHSDIRVEYHNIANNTSNAELFTAYQEASGLSHAYVPIVFIGNTSFQGEEKIKENLDTTINSIKANQSSMALWVPGETNGQITINPIIFLVAALGEGVNPCGLLVLALLLVTLMASVSKRMVISVGLSYILAFFIVRLFSGFALFSVIQLPGIAKVFTLFAATIAFIAGIIQIRDGLLKVERPLLSIPITQKGKISSRMKEATILGGFIAGVLVGIYGLACTAGIYITILGMLGRDILAGTGYLILYNLLVTVPMLLVLLLVAFGIPPERVNTWREENKSRLRVLIGVIMVVMAFVIIIPYLPF